MVDPSRVGVTGAFAPFAEGFVVAVAEAGYPPNGAAKQVQLLAHLSRWLETEGLGPADLDVAAIGRFFAARRAAGYRERLTPRSGEVLFAYLRGLGVVPMASAPPAPQGPLEELLARFGRYLMVERGLLADTAEGYVRSVRVRSWSASSTPTMSTCRGWTGRRWWRSWSRAARAVARLGEADGDGVAVAAGVLARRGGDRALVGARGAGGRWLAVGGVARALSPTRCGACWRRATGAARSGAATSRS